MSYAKFEIIHGSLNSMAKKISANTLKVGDRFIYKDHGSLMFKTNVAPKDEKYLCCDEEGKVEWIGGNEKVIKINGIAATLSSYSQKFKEEVERNEFER